MTITILNKSVEQEDDKKIKPHLALTHQLQGGAANGRNISLLMKSESELTEEQKKLVETLAPKEVIQKASYTSVYASLAAALRNKFSTDTYDYIYPYVVDFDDTDVVFENSNNLYSIGYTVVENKVFLDEQAFEVSSYYVYEKSTDKVLLADTAKKKNDVTVRDLIIKSVDLLSGNEKIKNIIKSKSIHTGEETVSDQALIELQKSLDTSKVALEKSNAELMETKTQMQVLLKSLDDIKVAARKDKLTEVVTDSAELEVLIKAVGSLDDDSFAVILKSLQAKKEQVDESGLFTQQSDATVLAKPAKNTTVNILKARYAK